MDMRLWRTAFLLALALAALGGVALAAEPAPGVTAPQPTIGLAAEPGGMLIQDVTPGESYDLAEKTGVLLTIRNRDRNEHTYVVSSHRPSEVGNRRVPQGYEDIVDPSWLSFEQAEVRVPGQGSSQVRMYLRVLDDERYHNQHWSVSVAVVGKPEPGETLTLAVYPRFEIETTSASRTDLHLRPAGAIGVAPAIVTLAPSGNNGRLVGEFVICNNDEKKHSYVFRAMHRGDLGNGRQIFPSGGYAWLPDSAPVVVRPPAPSIDARWSARWWPKLWLAPHRHVAVPVQVALPHGAAPPAPGWEAVVLVERNDGALGFLRIRTPTAEPSG